MRNLEKMQRDEKGNPGNLLIRTKMVIVRTFKRLQSKTWADAKTPTKK
jgi:hypothetical protein